MEPPPNHVHPGQVNPTNLVISCFKLACRGHNGSMTITQDTAKLIFMPMADILALHSMDAEAEMDYQALGLSTRAPLAGVTVADILDHKRDDIAARQDVYGPVEEHMRANGQTAPVHSDAGYLFNGHHRVAIALNLGWAGMWVTDELELSSDEDFDALHLALAYEDR